MLARLLVLVAMFALTSCSEVSGTYATLQEAKSDAFIGRGWLPDVLPATTVNIRWSNNLDVNTSQGSFEFAPTEFTTFALRLNSHVPTAAPFNGWEAEIRTKVAKGFLVGEYSEDRTTWVFLCTQARNACEYVSWLKRHG